MSIKIIAAVSKNGVIGRRSTNSIPWDYHEDMRFFLEQTRSGTVVMGRKTFESIGKPLPKRRNIVITRSKIDGVECFDNVEQAINSCPKEKHYLLFESAEAEEKYKREHAVWIIGGEHIYREGLQFADEIFLTLIPEHVDGIAGVACFPWINPAQFQVKDYITLESERETPIQVAHYTRL